jgi:hypothetical protein
MMNARTTDPTAIRVARRHAAAVPPADIPTTRLNVGSIYAIEPKLMLEGRTGYLRNFRFRPAVDGPSTTVAWEGVSEAGGVVSGKLMLHVEVGENEVGVWAEVVVDQKP